MSPESETPHLGPEGDLPRVRVMEPPRYGTTAAPTTLEDVGSRDAGPGSVRPLPRNRGEPEIRGVGQSTETHRRRSRWYLPRWPQGTVRALALAVVGGAVLVLVWVLPRVAGEEDARSPEAPVAEEDCPERVAALVPGQGPGTLVEAFETERHRIVLCTNDVGELYYFGEFVDDEGEAIVLPATRTAHGYVAASGRIRYEIVGEEVIITGADGEDMARLDLIPVPEPE